MSSRVIEIITSSFTKLLIPGLVYTIPITLISFAIGLLIAIVTALIRVKKIKVLFCEKFYNKDFGDILILN